jgi:hypothetical protein
MQNLHFPEYSGRFDPNWDAAERSQASLDLMPLRFRDTGLGTSSRTSIAMPSTPFHDSYSGNTKVRLHGKEHFVIPLCSPFTVVSAMEVDWKEYTDHD